IADKEIEVRAILMNPPRPKVFDKAKQAFAALQALKSLYLQPTMAEQQEGLNAINEMEEEVPVPDEKKTDEEAPVKEDEPKEEVIVKEKTSVFDKALLMAMAVKKEKPIIVNVTTPKSPDINVTIQPQEINVTQPDIIMGDTHNHLPKQDAPKVEIKNLIPKQQTPNVSAQIN